MIFNLGIRRQAGLKAGLDASGGTDDKSPTCVYIYIYIYIYMYIYTHRWKHHKKPYYIQSIKKDLYYVICIQYTLFVLYIYTLQIQHGTKCYSWSRLTWNYATATVSSGFCSPGSHATNFFNRNNRNLTWNRTQRRPKLNPNCTMKQPTWNLNKLSKKTMWQFKADVKLNLEPKWLLKLFG